MTYIYNFFHGNAFVISFDIKIFIKKSNESFFKSGLGKAFFQKKFSPRRKKSMFP